MKNHRIVLAILALLFLALPAFAQDGGVTGTVKDETGGVMPGVQITAKNSGTGQARTAWASADGRFTISGLTPGVYDIMAELQNFATFSLTGLRIAVGAMVPVNVVLKPAGVSESMSVTAERTVIQTTESEVSNAIPEELIASLPVAERNAISLALLVPGVSAAPYFDPTKSRDNFDGVSFGGASASENLILVDGADNNDDVVGSILQFYPQDSIQEFEVITSRFKAEYGHTDGGVVNMITKSGSNSFSGGGYWLFRDDKLNSKTFVEADHDSEKATFRQNVAGAYIGGPIQTDKAFFFANYDYTKRPATVLSSTGGLLPEVDAQGQVPQDFKQKLAVGKLTANLTDKNFFTARYAYQDDSTVNVNLLPTDGLEHGGLGSNTYHAVLGKLQSVLGGDKLNEFHWQYNTFENAIVSSAVGSPLEFRELLVGASSLGHNSNHPQLTTQDKHQIVDSFSFRAQAGGDHDFKVGFEYQHVKMGGQFSTEDHFAQFVWDNETDYLAGAFADNVTLFNGPLFYVGSSTNNIYSFFIQDDWKVSPKLTLNLGLRYDVETNDWTQSSERAADGSGPGRTFITSDPLFFGGQPETDKNNFGPRVGFAYDVNGTGDLVVRGGWGVYYQQIFWNSPIRYPFVEGPTLGSDFKEGADVTFMPGDPFCSENPGVRCIPDPDQPPANAAGFVGSNAANGPDPNMKTPFTHQFSLGFGKQLSSDWGLDVDFVHTESTNQIYRTRRAGRSTINGINVTNQGNRALTDLNGAEQRYNGLLVALHGRIEKLTTQVSYGFGRGKGHVARQTTAVIDDRDSGFDNNYGSTNAQRDHQFAASLFYDLPMEFQIGTVLKFQSGFAFTALDPTLGDVDGDGSASDSIAFDGVRGNSRGDSFSQVDVRLSKKFTFGSVRPQVFFEVFNAFNSRNEKFDSVSTNVNSATFGISPQVAGQARNAQVSVRFDF